MIRRRAVELYFLLGAACLITALVLTVNLAAGALPLWLIAAAIALFIAAGVAADVRAEEEFKASLANNN